MKFFVYFIFFIHLKGREFDYEVRHEQSFQKSGSNLCDESTVAGIFYVHFFRRFVLHNFVMLVQNCSYYREIVGKKLEAKLGAEISTPSHTKPQVVNLNKNQSERNFKSTDKVPEHDQRAETSAQSFQSSCVKV